MKTRVNCKNGWKVPTIDCIYPWTHPPKTCFHAMSSVWVLGVKLWSFPAQKSEVLLLNTAQREDVSNQQKGSFCLSWNTPEEEEERLCMAKQLSLGSRTSDSGRENFKVWHLKLRRLTSRENTVHSRVDAIDSKYWLS